MPRLVPGLVACLCLVPACLRAEAPALQKPYFDSNGVKIHYVVQGKEDGEPVLLIHGFTLNAERQWAPILKALAKDYRVIAMDCRGHGASEKPHDPGKYGLEMTRDAVRLLDHLKIERAHVVGYSMGGSIALQVAARYPERVRTVTLGGMGLPEPGRAKLMEALADSLEKGQGLGPLVLALTPKDRPRPGAEQIAAINAMLLPGNDTKALAAVIRGSITDKNLALSEAQVKGIKAPMLALIGADDPLKSGVDALKKQLPGVKVIVIDNADHMMAFGREEFVRGLKEFLDAHRSAKR